ncbi:hypothetical protein C8R44DRAFT_852880 [Mycena epipterygia]|nr:hypothetical protein C8R44DRAFT_852880 [Mycena epipterygia]
MTVRGTKVCTRGWRWTGEEGGTRQGPKCNRDSESGGTWKRVTAKEKLKGMGSSQTPLGYNFTMPDSKRELSCHNWDLRPLLESMQNGDCGGKDIGRSRMTRPERGGVTLTRWRKLEDARRVGGGGRKEGATGADLCTRRVFEVTVERLKDHAVGIPSTEGRTGHHNRDGNAQKVPLFQWFGGRARARSLSWMGLPHAPTAPSGWYTGRPYTLYPQCVNKNSPRSLGNHQAQALAHFFPPSAPSIRTTVPLLWILQSERTGKRQTCIRKAFGTPGTSRRPGSARISPISYVEAHSGINTVLATAVTRVGQSVIAPPVVPKDDAPGRLTEAWVHEERHQAHPAELAAVHGDSERNKIEAHRSIRVGENTKVE